MTSPQRKTILITGASGFIGGQLSTRFRQDGWNIVGVGRRHIERDQYYSWDLSQTGTPPWQHALNDVDVILHAAARTCLCN